VDFELSQRLFHAFDPQKPLRQDTEALYVARSEEPASEQLASELRFHGTHRFLLAGAVGSGKSTELFRMFKAMQDDARYVTVLLDLFEQFRVDSLSAGQVIFLVALAVLRASEVDAGDLEERLREAYLGVVDGADARDLNVGRLITGLATLVAGAATGAGGAVVANAAGKAIEAVDLRVALPGRGRTLEANDPRAQRLGSALNEAVRKARDAQKGRRFLVLVDGLDKVRDDGLVRDFFCNGVLASRDVTGLDLVYAAPPSLRFQVGYGGGTGFQMIRLGLFRLFHRDGTDDRAEFEAMRQVLLRRIESTGLDPATVLPDRAEGEAIDETIRATGGLARDLIHVVRRAIVQAPKDGPRASLRREDLAAGVRKRAMDYLDLLDLERERLLAETWREKQRPGGAQVDHLLNDNLILCYDNGTPWCRPHPMVLPRLRERFGLALE
jgi:hypothetical protein